MINRQTARVVVAGGPPGGGSERNRRSRWKGEVARPPARMPIPRPRYARPRHIGSYAGPRPEEKMKDKPLDYNGVSPGQKPRSRESRGRVGLAKVGWEVEQA